MHVFHGRDVDRAVGIEKLLVLLINHDFEVHAVAGYILYANKNTDTHNHKNALDLFI